jgi:mycofactocin precursor
MQRNKEKQPVKDGEETEQKCEDLQESDQQDPDILEEIDVEEFAVDGICGVY